jgi:hypothetical protein
MYLHAFSPMDLSQWLSFLRRNDTTKIRTWGSTMNAIDLALDFSCQKDVFAFLFAQFLESLEEVW